MIDKISILIENRDYSHAIELIDQVQSQPNIDGEVSHQMDLFRLRILRLQGDFQEAKNFVIGSDIGNCQDNDHRVQFYLETATTWYRLGRIQTAMDNLSYVETIIYEENNISQYHREFYDLKGKLHLYQNQLDAAMNAFEHGLSLNFGDENDALQASMTNGIGIAHFYRGHLERATDYYKRALEINVELHDLKQIGISYNNLGYIYYIQGNPEKSISYLEQSLNAHTSYDIDYYRSTALFNLIRSYIMIDDLDTAKEYFNQLEHIAQKPTNAENEHILVVKTLCDAIIRQQGSRLRDKYEAEKLFEKVLELGGEQQFIIIAMIHLSELLILELKISEDDFILNKIEELAQRLQILANEMNSISIEIQTRILEVKLNRVRGDYKQAHQSYQEILKKAKNNNLHILVEQINHEIKQLKEEVQKMATILNQNPSIIDRLDVVELKTYLDELKSMI